MPENNIQSTTQQYLDIHDITNDLVIMKDGTTSLILTVDAMNFGLLAEEEQDSIIYAYAGLLNSLNYPIQVIVKSQTKDVTSYLRLLQEQESSADSPENRQRIRRYREFVSNLIQERNVLDKKFYVIIPAAPIELGLLSADSVIPGRQTFDVASVERSVLLDKAKNILEPKRDHLISQFARIGLFSRQLNTQEIIQYFYISYNPEAAEGQEIADSNSYSTPMVKASFEGFSMNQSDPLNQPTAPAAEMPQQPEVPEAPQAVPEVPAAPEMPIEPQMPVAPQPPVQAPPAPAAEPVMPPTPALPGEGQAIPNIPVETEDIKPPVAAAPAEPTAPAGGEVALQPNQDQNVTPSPAAPATPDPDLKVVQQEIDSTLGQLGTNVVPPAAEPEPTTPAEPSDDDNDGPPQIPEIN